MSKQKLDAALIASAPAVAPAKPQTFATDWEVYHNNGVGAAYHKVCSKKTDLYQDTDWDTGKKAAQSMQNWDSIPYYIGFIHRMQEDGKVPLQKLGMTVEQEAQFMALCREIRNKLLQPNIVMGQETQRTTITKQIYDSIIANHF